MTLTKLSDRDKRILQFLPGAAGLIGYVLWFSLSGNYSARSSARTSMEKAEKAIPAEQTARTRQIELAMRRSEVQQKKKDAEAAKSRFEHQLACVDPDCRAARMHRLTSLLTQHGLTVIEHGTVEGTKDKLPLSASALHKQLPNAATLQLHKIRFVARYQDVVQATAALSAEGAMAIPVSLTMKESKDFSVWHEWQMLVWV